MENRSIESLIKDAKGGDHKAFKHLFDGLSDRLFAYAISHVKNREDAMDLVQDTFIDLWNGLPKFKYKNDESFYGFVFLILKRKMYRHYHKKPNTVELDENFIADNYEIEIEDYRFLEKVIDKLPEKYQELLKLRYWSQFSFKEIAVVMDVKEGTAKVWHHRAVKSLQGHLKDVELS